MPRVFACRFPMCDQFARRPNGFCANHNGETPRPNAARHRRYDRTQRDREAKRFYDSAAWKRARAIKLEAEPFCERCRLALAGHVHHLKPLKRCTPAEAIAQWNLQSLCPPCHSEIEATED